MAGDEIWQGSSSPFVLVCLKTIDVGVRWNGVTRNKALLEIMAIIIINYVNVFVVLFL